MWWQFVSLCLDIGRYSNSTANGFADRIEEYFGSTLYVFLKRRCVVSQAISYVRAAQTGQWARRSREEVSSVVPVYDEAEIRIAIEGLARSYELWATFFNVSKIAPIHMWYEDLVEEPDRELQIIASRCGLEVSRAAGEVDKS
jgi:LPS sulfotransferase NodH